MPADQFGAKPYSRPAPTVPPQRVSRRYWSNSVPGGKSKITETIVGDGRATLHVEQYVVAGPTDLAGEQAERVDLRLVAEPDRQANIAA